MGLERSLSVSKRHFPGKRIRRTGFVRESFSWDGKMVTDLLGEYRDPGGCGHRAVTINA